MSHGKKRPRSVGNTSRYQLGNATFLRSEVLYRCSSPPRDAARTVANVSRHFDGRADRLTEAGSREHRSKQEETNHVNSKHSAITDDGESSEFDLYSSKTSETYYSTKTRAYGWTDNSTSQRAEQDLKEQVAIIGADLSLSTERVKEEIVAPCSNKEWKEAHRIADMAKRAEERARLRALGGTSTLAPSFSSPVDDTEQIETRQQIADQLEESDEARNPLQLELDTETEARARALAEVAKRAEAASAEGFWCDICQMQIQSQTRRNHQTSTLHLFHRNIPSMSHKIWIPESNRGFQILERIGWERETGLGPNQEGRVEPIPTELRRDRKGLGLRGGSSARRVTHFPPHDEKEAKKSKDNLSAAQRAQIVLNRNSGRKASDGPDLMNLTKAQRRRREQKEKQREKRLNWELRKDVPAGYEEYFM